MPPTLEWREIVLRLAMAALAGTLIGINRGEHGRPAGLRTTLLLCLAAAMAMIEANLLLATSGKGSTSFVQIDPMRLPLGMLSGIGFIGAGSILKKGDRVLGVTTAATMWFVTVLGLVIGAGHIGLGGIGLALGLVILWCLKWVEMVIRQERNGILLMTILPQGPSDEEIRGIVEGHSCKISSWGLLYSNRTGRRRVRCAVNWRAPATDVHPPKFVSELARRDGVERLRWTA